MLSLLSFELFLSPLDFIAFNWEPTGDDLLTVSITVLFETISSVLFNLCIFLALSPPIAVFADYFFDKIASAPVANYLLCGFLRYRDPPEIAAGLNTLLGSSLSKRPKSYWVYLDRKWGWDCCCCLLRNELEKRCSYSIFYFSY